MNERNKPEYMSGKNYSRILSLPFELFLLQGFDKKILNLEDPFMNLVEICKKKN